MAAAYPINPMYLLGRTFHFHETIVDCVVAFDARVIAVQVPLPGSDVEWALLLEQRLDNGALAQVYSKLDNLDFAWPTVGSPGPSSSGSFPSS